MEIDEKTCVKCDETKPLTDFYKELKGHDGYRNDCKTCKQEYQGEYYIKNRDKIIKHNNDYYATNCDWIRPLKNKRQKAVRDLKKINN